jgi:hypothetical protein
MQGDAAAFFESAMPYLTLPIDASPGYNFFPFAAPYVITLERQIAKHVPDVRLVVSRDRFDADRPIQPSIDIQSGGL